jgi:osmotically-inducible protein OsmY
VLDRVQKIGVRHIDDRITIHNANTPSIVDSSRYLSAAESNAPASDQEVQKQVNDVLRGSLLGKGFKNVNAQVMNGNVNLTGFVETEDAHRDLLDKINDIDGVKNINDRVMVKSGISSYRSQAAQRYLAQAQAPSMRAQAAQPTEADRALNKKVRDALQGGFFSKGYENIQSDVRDGVVALRGTVANDSDRNTIRDRVQKIDGVRRVDLQITVTPKS